MTEQLNTSTEFGTSIPASVTIETRSPDDSIIIASQQDDSDDHGHPSISPATPAESLFLSHLSTDRVSATVLASSIHRVHSARSIRSSNTSTGDFFSAHGSIDSNSPDVFGTDILVYTSTIDEDREHSFSNSNMMSMSKSKTIATGTTVPTKPTAEEEPHFDTATHLYSTAKSAWSWSRSLPLAGPILGLYETAGVKILTTATKKDATTLDSEIAHHIGGLDKDVIDPAISKILQIIWPGVEKVEDIVKTLGPKIPFVVYLFPMLTEEGEKTSPETSTPFSLN